MTKPNRRESVRWDSDKPLPTYLKGQALPLLPSCQHNSSLHRSLSRRKKTATMTPHRTFHFLLVVLSLLLFQIQWVGAKIIIDDHKPIQHIPPKVSQNEYTLFAVKELQESELEVANKTPHTKQLRRRRADEKDSRDNFVFLAWINSIIEAIIESLFGRK